MHRPAAFSFFVGLTLMSAVSAHAQSYPTRPVRFVTAGVGGGNDFVARLIAQGISGPLGQPVIVDNRPGVSTIPGQVVSQSQPDGYTLWTSRRLDAISSPSPATRCAPLPGSERCTDGRRFWPKRRPGRGEER